MLKAQLSSYKNQKQKEVRPDPNAKFVTINDVQAVRRTMEAEENQRTVEQMAAGNMADFLYAFDRFTGEEVPSQ